MIICDLDIAGVSVGHQILRPLLSISDLPAEAHPPLVIDANAILALPITPQRLEPIGGGISQFHQPGDRLKFGDSFHCLQLEGGKFRYPLSGEKLACAFVPTASNRHAVFYMLRNA
jgi:hypothetical protein